MVSSFPWRRLPPDLHSLLIMPVHSAEINASEVAEVLLKVGAISRRTAVGRFWADTGAGCTPRLATGIFSSRPRTLEGVISREEFRRHLGDTASTALSLLLRVAHGDLRAAGPFRVQSHHDPKAPPCGFLILSASGECLLASSSEAWASRFCEVFNQASSLRP